MKNLAILAFALIVSGSAFAAENLTVAQMDLITAGNHRANDTFAAVDTRVNLNVTDSNRVQVVTPVSTAVAVNSGSGDATAASLQFVSATQNN